MLLTKLFPSYNGRRSGVRRSGTNLGTGSPELAVCYFVGWHSRELFVVSSEEHDNL